MIDLFAGAGGMTRGFTDEGFEAVGAVENDLAAASTYATNFGSDHVAWDRVEAFLEPPPADVVVGGPPCQGFSNLGNKEENDDRNRLFEEFLRVVDSSGAQAFVLENVGRFRRTPQCKALVRMAKELGFASPTVLTLNAADYGAAQNRQRTIVFGARNGIVAAPSATHSRDEQLGTAPWRNLRDVIGDVAFDPPHLTLPDRSTSPLEEQIPGPFELSELHLSRNYQERSLERFTHVAPGRNRFDIPDELLSECWRKHKSGAGDVMGRLEWEKPAVTIRTEFFKPEKGRYLHPEWTEGGRKVNRALTHEEAALIQGFDARHVWCGSKVEIARQIGNAVPPPLAAALARTVRQHLTDSQNESLRLAA